MSLAGIQEANRINIHEIYFLQIQRYPSVSTLDCGVHLVEVLKPKLTAQPNSSSRVSRKLFNFQRHYFQARTRHYKCKNKAILNCRKNKDLAPNSILNFEDFLTNEEKGFESGFPAGHSEWVRNFPRRVLDFVIKMFGDAGKNLARCVLVQLGGAAHERERCGCWQTGNEMTEQTQC